jgi:hypothetical protein
MVNDPVSRRQQRIKELLAWARLTRVDPCALGAFDNLERQARLSYLVTRLTARDHAKTVLRTGMKQLGFLAEGDPVSAQFHRNGRVIVFPHRLECREWLTDELAGLRVVLCTGLGTLHLWGNWPNSSKRYQIESKRYRFHTHRAAKIGVRRYVLQPSFPCVAHSALHTYDRQSKMGVSHPSFLPKGAKRSFLTSEWPRYRS